MSDVPRALIHHPYPLLHRDLVVVADGVFTQEVKLHHKLLAILLGVQVDVLHTQRAAAHRVCRLPLLLLVTCPQSQLVRDKQQGVSSGPHSSRRWPTQSVQRPALGSSFHHDSGIHLVNEVEGHGPLADPHFLGLPVLVVLAPDAVHALLQSTCCLVLLPVLLPLTSRQTLYSQDTDLERLEYQRGL